MSAEKEIMRLTNCIVEKFNPVKIILFGSQAKGTATAKSDIDLCVIADVEKENKRALRSDIDSYLACDCDPQKGYDVLVYAEDEWNARSVDLADFAHIIKDSGVVLYG